MRHRMLATITRRINDEFNAIIPLVSSKKVSQPRRNEPNYCADNENFTRFDARKKIQ